MSTADELAVAVAGLRPVAEDLALPDSCTVRRSEEGPRDSRNNPTYTDTTVATARCRLRGSAQMRPQERAVADRVQAVTPYAIDLPYTIALLATDDLIVNDTRRFEIVGIVKEGDYGVFAVAVCEERS